MHKYSLNRSALSPEKPPISGIFCAAVQFAPWWQNDEGWGEALSVIAFGDATCSPLCPLRGHLPPAGGSLSTRGGGFGKGGRFIGYRSASSCRSPVSQRLYPFAKGSPFRESCCRRRLRGFPKNKKPRARHSSKRARERGSAAGVSAKSIETNAEPLLGRSLAPDHSS